MRGFTVVAATICAAIGIGVAIEPHDSVPPALETAIVTTTKVHSVVVNPTLPAGFARPNTPTPKITFIYQAPDVLENTAYLSSGGGAVGVIVGNFQYVETNHTAMAGSKGITSFFPPLRLPSSGGRSPAQLQAFGGIGLIDGGRRFVRTRDGWTFTLDHRSANVVTLDGAVTLAGPYISSVTVREIVRGHLFPITWRYRAFNHAPAVPLPPQLRTRTGA